MTDIKMSQQEYEKRIDKIKVCGANRGPHDYIPIEFAKNETMEMVRMLMCRVCFNRVSIKTLYEHFGESRV
jgi:uncharacterized protein YlaI